ncbi:MAG: IPT/TIG domain-containing protein [Acidimicrobiales bacterium]
MPTGPTSSADEQRRRARSRKLVAAAALATGLFMLGHSVVGSSEVDGAAETTQSDSLIAEAIAQGLLSEDDLAGAAGEVASAIPTVTAVAPVAGPLKGGQIVVLTGTGFTSASAVNFNNVAAGDVAATNYAIVSDTRIVATVPDAAAAGAKTLKVTNTDGTNATGPSYTYGAPTVTAVAPAFADPATGKIVTITGTGFTGAVLADVKFGTWAPQSIWVVSDTQIIARTPIDDAVATPAIDVTEGITDVVVTRNSVVSPNVAGSKFLFSPGAPTITTLGATGAEVTGTDGAAVGTLLTITGTRLWGTSKVNFGATAVTLAADIVVANDGLTMTVKVPTRATSGPVDVTVENVIGVSTTNLKTRFNYIGTVAPTITSVNPNVLNKAASGGGGTFLVVGTGYTGVTTAKVTLKCTTDVVPTSVVVVSDTNLIVTAPGNIGSVAEACDLEIVNPVDATKKATLLKTAATAVRYV